MLGPYGCPGPRATWSPFPGRVASCRTPARRPNSTMGHSVVAAGLAHEDQASGAIRPLLFDSAEASGSFAPSRHGSRSGPFVDGTPRRHHGPSGRRPSSRSPAPRRTARAPRAPACPRPGAASGCRCPRAGKPPATERRQGVEVVPTAWQVTVMVATSAGGITPTAFARLQYLPGTSPPRDTA